MASATAAAKGRAKATTTAAAATATAAAATVTAAAAPPVGPLERTVTHRLHTLQKRTDAISQAAYRADAGMSLSEGRCLAAVGAFTPLSVNDLALRANLTKGQASRAAQALVASGLVRKAASVTDGRGVVLTLTAKGRRAWDRVMRVIERRNAEILACLDAAERRQFDRLLDRLVAHVRAPPQRVHPASTPVVGIPPRRRPA